MAPKMSKPPSPEAEEVQAVAQLGEGPGLSREGGGVKVVINSADDVKYINWNELRKHIGQYVMEKIGEAITDAGEQLKTLNPGESKTIVIQIGHIEISREADSSATVEAEIGAA